MMVLGIDPGTAAVGFGVVTAGSGGRLARLVECGVIRTDSGSSLPDRLKAIHEGLAELLDRHHPDAIAVEGIFFGQNARTCAVLGHGRGVVLLAAAQAGLGVVEYSPARVKKVIVGRGAAAKPQVAFMVAKLLGLTAPPKPADAADGVAIALTHLLAAGPRRRAKS